MSERLSSIRAGSVEPKESGISRRAELECLEGSAQAARARLAEEQQVRTDPILGSLLSTLFHFCLSLEVTRFM